MVRRDNHTDGNTSTINFPHWVHTTRCTTRTCTRVFARAGRHGADHYTMTLNNGRLSRLLCNGNNVTIHYEYR